MPGLTDDVSQPSVLAVVLGRYHQLHLGGHGPSTLHVTGCPGYTLDSSVAVHREMFSSSHGQGNGPREVVTCRSQRSTATVPPSALTASLGVFSSSHLLVCYLSAPVVDRRVLRHRHAENDDIYSVCISSSISALSLHFCQENGNSISISLSI